MNTKELHLSTRKPVLDKLIGWFILAIFVSEILAKKISSYHLKPV